MIVRWTPGSPESGAPPLRVLSRDPPRVQPGPAGRSRDALHSDPTEDPLLSTIRRYLVATFFVVVTYVVRQTLDPAIGETTPFVVLFLLPVVISAWRVGLGPARFAAVLALVIGDRVTMDPDSGAPLAARVVRAATFLLVGALVAQLVVSRRRNEDALRESEARYRTMAENFPNSAVLLFDTDLRYLVAAGRGLPVIGLSSESMRGKTLHEALPSETADRLMPLFRAALRGEPQVAEVPYGRRTYLTHVVPVRDPNGDITQGMALALDVTERNRLEQQLRQAQKMDAIGRLAGGVAHDFNNLLTVILGRCEGMLRRARGSDDPTIRDVQAIHEAGKRAAALTKQLLSFSRAQATSPAIVDLNEVVRGMEQMIGRLIGEQIELRTRLVPTLGKVQVDRGQIEQVLLNLCVNARDALVGRAGIISIETCDVSIPAPSPLVDVPPGDYVRVAVADTGCGIDDAVRDRIFEPFFTTKGVGEGTGLGLSIVHGVVGQHRGYVTVASERGHGSSFAIYLPRSEAAERSEAAALPAASPKANGELVLLVEDEDSVRAMIAEFLTTTGYRVLPARSGEEALALEESRRGTIGLLMTDVVLTGISGIELVRRLRAADPGLRALFLSGYSQELAAIDDFGGARTAFLPKPFTLDDLLARITALLREREAPPAHDEARA